MSSLSSAGSTAAASTLAGLNTSGIQFSGLASGVDTNQLIQGLLAVQQAKITNLQNRQKQVVSEQAAFKTLQADLLNLQTQAGRLSGTFNSVFSGRTATTSAQDLATAAASSGAQAGVYNFRVNALAQAQQLASQGFDAATSTITQGTFQLRVGSGPTTTLTIDGTNNTVQGLADAINNAGAGVTATVVNDGSGTQAYRLLLTAKQSGTANAVTLTNSLAADGGGAVRPDFGTIVQPATDASVSIGSGAGALTVTSPTNTVDGLFQGVTLNLVGADPNRPVTVTVANDTDTASKAIHDFVDSFNSLVDFVNQGNTYDPQSKQAGIFLGDPDAIGIEDTVTQAVTDAVRGVNALSNNLAAVGITLDDTGKLSVDDTKLTQALSGQLSGVSADDVRRLFVLDGQSTSSAVQFVTAGSKTQVIGNPVEVQVTQAATGGSALASNALAASSLIDGTNNTLTVAVDGRTSGTITLAAGTYTAQALAQEVQTEIDANSQLGGLGVLATVDGGKLRLTSRSYGSNSRVAIGSGTALATLGFTGTEAGVGQDVAGSFLVNGVTEAATGSGQFLTGLSSNAATAGLQVRVPLAPSQVAGGVAATLTVSRGIASSLGQVLGQLLDPVSGRLHFIDQAFQSQVDDLQQTIDRNQANLQDRQQALLQQFTDMETTISQLKAAGDFLTNQFASTSSSKS